MSAPKSVLAYEDCTDAMARAMEAPHGVRVRMNSAGEAAHFRMRCNNVRQLIRKENLKFYDPDHPMHGRCAYDPLVITLREVDGVNYCYMKKVYLDASRIEELEEEVEPFQIEAKPALQIEDRSFDLDFEAEAPEAASAADEAPSVKSYGLKRL